MEIKGISLRILKELCKKSRPTPVVYGAMCMAVGINSAEECKQHCKILIEQELIENDGTKIWVVQKGRDFINQLINSENEEIYKTLFDNDYFFTLLKFIYEMNEPFDVDELPKLLIDHCPNPNNHTNAHELMCQFEFGEMKKYVNRIVMKTGWYEINEAGKRYYEHLRGLTERQPEKIHSHHLHIHDSKIEGPIIQGSQVSQSPITFKKNKESKQSKALSLLGFKLSRQQLIWTIIGVLLGLLTILIALKPKWLPF